MERRKRKLSGSTAAKVIAFFLLAASFLTGIAGVAGCVAVYAEGVGSREDTVKSFLWSEAQHDLDIAMEYVHGAWDDSWNEEYFSDRNSGVEIFVEDKKVWSCYDGKKTAYRFVRMGNVIGRLVREGTEYRFENGELDEVEDGYLEYTIYLYVGKMERRKRKLSGSTTSKVIAFFLLAASFLTGIAGVAGCVAVYAEGVGSREDNVKAFLWSEAQHDLDIAMEYVHGAWDDSWNEEYFSDRNSGVEIFVEDKKVWSCYDGKKTAYRFVRMGNVIGRLVREGTEYRFENGELDEIEDGYLEYTIYLYVDDEFPVADGYRIMAQTAGTIYDMRTIWRYMRKVWEAGRTT